MSCQYLTNNIKVVRVYKSSPRANKVLQLGIGFVWCTRFDMRLNLVSHKHTKKILCRVLFHVLRHQIENIFYSHTVAVSLRSRSWKVPFHRRHLAATLLLTIVLFGLNQYNKLKTRFFCLSDEYTLVVMLVIMTLAWLNYRCYITGPPKPYVRLITTSFNCLNSSFTLVKSRHHCQFLSLRYAAQFLWITFMAVSCCCLLAKALQKKKKINPSLLSFTFLSVYSLLVQWNNMLHD